MQFNNIGFAFVIPLRRVNDSDTDAVDDGLPRRTRSPLTEVMLAAAPSPSIAATAKNESPAGRDSFPGSP
jgi:hypothetical protein